jgi:tripartite-type tricarboxylate transporter receptor subunit TctC
MERLSSRQNLMGRNAVPIWRLWRLAFAVLAVTVAAGPLHAQIGAQPIRIIFPFAAGGSGDAASRIIAERMNTTLGRPVIVENRTGADGRIGVRAVKEAAPDGNTLLLTPIAPISIYQYVYARLDYDPIADFAPISEVGTFDFGIAVGPQADAKTSDAKTSDVRTLKDLVAWAKAHPADANFAIPAAGTLPHFLGIMLGRAAGIDLRPVPYRGSAAGLTDLIAGHIPIEVTTTSDLVQMAKDGRIRVLATSGKERSPFLPDVPTLHEAGFDLAAAGWYGMFAPAKTPADLIERYNKAIVDAVRSPEFKDRMLAFGLQPAETSAAAFARIVQDDSALWVPAIKASGFKAEE